MKMTGPMLAICLAFAAQPAAAESNEAKSRELGECLTLKTNGEDRIMLAGWIVSALASAPQLKGVAVIAPEKREEYNRGLAKLFTRLMTVDCKAIAIPMLKSGDTAAFKDSFTILGQMAMQEITANKEADEAMGEFTKYIDFSQFRDLAK